jgi:GNAT superfamily N-acetyltransferase
MPWQLTRDIGEFTAAAGGYLRADPVRNTVPLSVLAALHGSGLAAYGDTSPVFGWHVSAGGPESGTVDGAVLQTPPHPLLVAGFPPGSAADLIRALGDRAPDGANMPADDTAEFSAAWAAATGGGVHVHHRMRLFRLAGLVPPDPPAPGCARAPGPDDFDLLVRWTEAFGAETATAGDAVREVREHLSYGGITLWAGDRPAAMAMLSREVAGVCRVGTVYTPPGRRGRGYGGAVTAAVSQQALDAGAADIVLYTDLANPTSNALYQRLGFGPVADRTSLDLRRPVTPLGHPSSGRA